MLDKVIVQAISDAVEANNQPKELSEKLVSWLDHLTQGNEDISNQESARRRCKVCFEVISESNSEKV